MKTVLSCLLTVLLAQSVARATGQADSPDEQVVFRSGDLGYHTYLGASFRGAKSDYRFSARANSAITRTAFRLSW